MKNRNFEMCFVQKLSYSTFDRWLDLNAGNVIHQIGKRAYETEGVYDVLTKPFGIATMQQDVSDNGAVYVTQGKNLTNLKHLYVHSSMNLNSHTPSKLWLE